MKASLVVRVDGATPIILNGEKSIILGILGTLSPWRSTKLSPGKGKQCADATSMRTQEFGDLSLRQRRLGAHNPLRHGWLRHQERPRNFFRRQTPSNRSVSATLPSVGSTG